MGLLAPLTLLAAALAWTPAAAAEHTQSFRVKEDIPVGTVIGTVGDASSSASRPPPPPPYLIVPVGPEPDRDLASAHSIGRIFG